MVMPTGLMLRRCHALLPALILAAVSVQSASAQSADALLGRWEFVRIVNEQGEPDSDSEGAVALTFTSGGVLQIERTAEARAADPDAPDHVGYRVEGSRIVLEVEEGVEYGEFWFEGDELVILDRERALTAHLQRPPR